MLQSVEKLYSTQSFPSSAVDMLTAGLKTTVRIFMLCVFDRLVHLADHATLLVLVHRSPAQQQL